jgi:hypothetical protein
VQGGDNPNFINPLETKKSTLIPICKPSSGYVSIEALYHFCHVPAPCGKDMDCEGKIAKVKGYIDYSNVFDKKNYPWLPYEKLKIHDKKGKSLEIWAFSNDNRKVFEKVYYNKAFPEKMVFIKGKIVGFDMPIMGTCHRGIKIYLEKEDDLFFKY